MNDFKKDILKILSASNRPLSIREIKILTNTSTQMVTNHIDVLFKENYVLQHRYGSERTFEINPDINSLQHEGVSKSSTDFTKIYAAEQLVDYLTITAIERLSPNGYVCQYTNKAAIISIIRNKQWYLGNPKNMNDGLEFEQHDKGAWRSIFISSFMAEQKESIAMWSMYAQHWDDGVMVRIPVKVFKDWILNCGVVYEADTRTKSINRNKFFDLTKAQIRISRVAYLRLPDKGKGGKLSCGKAENNKFWNCKNKKLTGFIKDDAWSYENELRVRIDLDKSFDCAALGIEVPDNVINSMQIVQGPRFKGNLYKRLEKEFDRQIRVDKSQFYGKLKWIYCDTCSKIKNA